MLMSINNEYMIKPEPQKSNQLRTQQSLTHTNSLPKY